MKKFAVFTAIAALLTAVVGLAYYFFKLNPEYIPYKNDSEE